MTRKKYFEYIILITIFIIFLSGCTILSRLFDVSDNMNDSGYWIKGSIYYNGSVEPGYDIHFYIYLDPYDVNPQPEDNLVNNFSTNRTMDFSYEIDPSKIDHLVLLVYIDVNSDNVLSAGDYYAYFDPISGNATDSPVELHWDSEGTINVNFTFNDDFIWSGKLWIKKVFNNLDYEYMIFENPDISDFQGKITSATTDGNFLYIAGYYATGTYQHKCFVYQVSPSNGSIIAKYETDNFNDDGLSPENVIAPVIIKYDNNYVYMAFTDLYDNTSFLFRLTSDLKLKENLSEKVYTDFEIHDLVVDPSGEPDIYITGSYDNGTDKDIFLERAPLTSAEQIFVKSNAGEDSGNALILYNGKIYVSSLFDAYNDGTNYSSVFEFDKSSLSDLNYINTAMNAQALGICYNSNYGNFYASGYQQVSGYNRYTLISKVYTDLSNYDNNLSFDESPAPSFNVNDESGSWIIFDPDNYKMVICGYQYRTQSWDNDQKASLTILDTSENRMTIVFTNDDEIDSQYKASYLNRVVGVGDYYYGVGYALDIDGVYRPLLIRMKRY